MFGDQELVKMATVFGLVVAAALAEFREHKMNTKRLGKTLKDLKKNVELLPVASAECERGFSAMNLHAANFKPSLLTIQINGPPVHHLHHGLSQSM